MGKFFDDLKNFVAGSHNKNNSQSSNVNYQSLTEEQKRITLSIEQLQSFNWNNFGKTLVQGGLLPASYNAEPQSVDVYVGLDKLPRVTLTFGSEAEKTTQTLVIDKSSVMVAVDGHGYVDNAQMSRVWQEMTGLEPEKEIGPVM